MRKITLCSAGAHRFRNHKCLNCGYVGRHQHNFCPEKIEGKEWKPSCECIFGCGTRRDGGHVFENDSCICNKSGCGAKAPETNSNHKWAGFKCKVCERIKKHECDWSKSCICSCGKIAPYFYFTHKYRLTDHKCEICDVIAGPLWPHHNFKSYWKDGELIQTCICECGQHAPEEMVELHEWGSNGEMCICLHCPARRNTGHLILNRADGAKFCAYCGDGREELIPSK